MKIVFCFIFAVLGQFLVICNIDTFAEHAILTKPYSILFTDYINRGLSDSHKKKIIFFGDSSLIFPPDNRADSDDPTEHTPALLENVIWRKAPELDVSVSEWAFPGASMYHYYCMFYEALPHSPDVIIVPINWNTFGSIWLFLTKDEYPELCAFAPLLGGPSKADNPIRLKNISFMRHIQYKSEISSLYLIGLRRWVKDKILSYRHSADSKGDAAHEDKESDLEERPRETSHDVLQNAYPLEISTENEVIKCMQALSELGAKHRTKIVFYISPINCEYLQRTGYLDLEKFAKSKTVILDAAVGEGVYCIDLSDLLDDDTFYDIFEHYMASGRREIAERLSPTIIDILKADTERSSS